MQETAHGSLFASLGSLLLWLWACIVAHTAEYHVAVHGGDSNPGTSQAPFRQLRHAISLATAGDTIVVHPGRYSGQISLRNLHASANQPLVIKAAGDGAVQVVMDQIQSRTNFKCENCSYIVVQGITFTGGLFGVIAYDSHHLIFRDLTINNLGQEGMILQDDTQFVDVRNCRIHACGKKVAKYGEGIYIGSKGASAKDVPDLTKRIWVEACEIWDTGAGEAVDIAGSASETTIRDCFFHDIRTGTSDKWNNGVIVVAQQDARAGYEIAFRDIWLEGNTIHRQRQSSNPYLQAGIFAHGNGVRILRNTIRDCDGVGIATSDLKESDFPIWLHGNTISNCRRGSFRLDSNLTHHRNDPGPNPFSRQQWYRDTSDDLAPAPPQRLQAVTK